MFSNIQDALLFLVLGYGIFRVGWGDGFTLINTFIILGSLVAIIAMILRRTGYLAEAEKKKKEAMEQKEKNRK